MNKNLIRIANIAILSLCMVNAAMADTFDTDAQRFEDRILNYQKFCAQGCKNPFSQTPAFEFSEADKSKLESHTRANLEKAAFDQAQIWADTILEGDYVADGKTQLDSVFAIFENRQLIGYKITYSELAWYVGECDFSYDDRKTLKDCSIGRISESSFVSPDFSIYLNDETDLADFRRSQD